MRPYLRAANIGWGHLKLDDVKEMDFTPAEYETYALRPMDILLNEASGSAAEVGKPAIYRGEVEGACFQNTVLRVRVDADQADVGFMFQFLLRAALAQQLGDSSSGTNIQHIGRARLAVWPVALPHLGEQRKIAAVLSSVDEAIEKTQAVIDQVQVVKKALMQELLTRGLPGRHTKFKQTEVGEIPESWEVVQLGHVLATIDAGWSPRCDSRPAGPTEWGVLRVSAVSWGRFDDGENKRLADGLSPRPELEVKVGDIILSRANTTNLVGRPVYVEQCRNKLMLSDKTLRLNPTQLLNKRFLLVLLASESARQYIEDQASGSSTSMKNISQEKLRALIFGLPSWAEQEDIGNLASNILERELREIKYSDALKALKQSLMSVLLTGELRVTPS